jgi:electron transfer flavoprotein alpha subunit
MSSIRLSPDRCTGCEECAAACPYSAITMENGLPVIGDACNLCGACVDACPSGALEGPRMPSATSGLRPAQTENGEHERGARRPPHPGSARPKRKTANMSGAALDGSSYRDIWVFAEIMGGKPARVVLELLGAGRRLADQVGQRLCAVLLGEGCGALPEELLAHGADRVYVADHPALAVLRDEPYAAVLAAAVNQYRPSVLLFGATAAGRSLAPRLAARLRTGLTADCTGLDIDPVSGNLLQTRPAFGGNIMAAIVCPDHRPQMATVRPGVLKQQREERPPRVPHPEGTGRGSEDVVRLETGDDLLAARTVVSGFVLQETETVNLEDASIIVAGGRGLGSAENFALVRELAMLLGGAVGASRAAVDEGWVSPVHQIGQTGKMVAPRVYIACGISGAIQHLVGMQGAEIVVAINKNPDAPIFKAATYGLVGDVVQILNQLIEQLQAGS